MPIVRKVLSPLVPLRLQTQLINYRTIKLD